MQSKISHYPALDGLRGVCIILVLLHNLYPYGNDFGGVFSFVLHQIAVSGWVGVQWFFVLSGFLITGILLGYESNWKAVKTFYLRRSLRIFPVYYLTLLILLVFLPLLGWVYPGTGHAISNQFWFWLYLSNWVSVFGVGDLGFSHFWSLAVEEQFYLVWPWLILFARRKVVLIVIAILIISSPLIRILIGYSFREIAEQLAYQPTFVRWDALAIGALTAYCLKENILKSIIERHFVILIVVLGLWFVLILGTLRDFGAVAPGFGMLNQTLAAFIGMALIWICVTPQVAPLSTIGRILSLGVLRHFGKYSYAMYIFHLIAASGVPSISKWLNIGAGADKTPWAAWSTMLITILITYLLARLSWIAIEAPFLRLKNKLE